jgi:Fe-S cluster assembly ATP-binding protein
VSQLSINNLSVRVDNKQILSGVSLDVPAGETHVLMGPNGSGKSTLSHVLLGDPQYEVTSGTIKIGDVDITNMSVDERSAAGLFLAFQHPESIPGVSVTNFLRQAMAKRKNVEDFSVLEVRLAVMDWATKLGMDTQFIDRYLNEGFSGGEKKRNEILQMALLEPEVTILDEIDSGLDIDAVAAVGDGLKIIREQNPSMALLCITHYQRILEYMSIDRVHVLIDGSIIASGDAELAREIEDQGFDFLKERANS